MKNTILKQVGFLGAVVLLTACNQNYKLGASGSDSSQLSSSGSVSDIPSSVSGPNGSCTSDSCVAVSGEDPHKDPPPPPSNNPPPSGNKPSDSDGSCDHSKPSDSPDSSGSSSSDVVECDMNSHSDKIILVNNKFVVSHSNASSNRVCMSSNACMKLVNAFANAHNGTLDASQSAVSSSHQFTAIFGDDGVCNNATILSDAQVTADLLNQ